MGKPVEGNLAIGQSHLYRLTLQAGQYVHIGTHVTGKNNVSKLTLFDSNGKTIAVVQHEAPLVETETQTLLAIIPTSGDYLLEVSSYKKSDAAGHYTVSLAELRPATGRDKYLVSAWEVFTQARELHMAATAESFQQAVGLYLKAIPFFQQAENTRFEAVTLFLLGDIYNTQGEYEKSLEVSQQSLSVARATGDTNMQTNALMYLGEAYLYLAEYRKALETFQQPLLIWKSLGEKYTWGVGWALSAMANCYRLLGENRQAAELYEQALKIYQAIDYSPREHNRGSASVASNLGLTYSMLGEKQKAADYLAFALEYWRKANEPWGEARAHYYFGELYASLGDTRTALDYYQQALKLWQLSNDPFRIAGALNSMGNLHFKSGDQVTALDYLGQALELRRKINDRRGQAETLTSLGRVKASGAEKQEAIDLYRQALTLRREVGDRNGEAAALSYLGEAFYALGNKEQARDYFQSSLLLRRVVGDREGEADTLYQIARTERDLGKPDNALKSIEGAVGIVESVRASVASPELRASYLASVRDYYDFYLDLLMQRHRVSPAAGNDRLALQISERALARSLIEMLSESRANIREGVDPAILEREHDLQQQLNGKSEYQIRLLSGKHTPEQAAVVAAEISLLVSQLQETRAHIKATSPRYAALTQPQPLRAEQIQRELLGPDTLLLEYALGEERSYLWVVSPTSLTSYELAKHAEIEMAARRVYKLLTVRNHRVPEETTEQRQARIAAADAEFPQQAMTLSRLILGPATTQLGKKRLLVVAPGALQFIPFSALAEPMLSNQPSRNYQPLIVNHEIVSLPSASTLATLRQELAGRAPAPRAIALLADPVFETDDERLQGVKSSLPRRINASPASTARTRPSDLQRALEAFSENGQEFYFPRLYYTRWEAERIASLALARGVLKALDFRASRATAMSAELSRYRIVHFASHGFIHPAHPELSGIVLSLVDERGQTQDGFLRAYEIYNLKFSAELIVLSACRTGLGKDIRGEGLLSLTRGFMYAGAARVMVSVWSVEDKAAAELMVKFYRRLLSHRRLSAATALRAAQVEMWKHYSQPYYWAAFTLQGEWK